MLLALEIGVTAVWVFYCIAGSLNGYNRKRLL